MDEMIPILNPDMVLYEELILKKENLRKEAAQFQMEYLSVFGELLKDVLEKKIECIRKKKEIAFCQRCVNHGMPVNPNERDRYIQEEMEEYEQQLQRMAKEIQEACEAERVSDPDFRRIREIYYRIARMIHPDMRPDLSDDSRVQEYWNRAVAAYQYNRLSDLEDLEILVLQYLKGEETQKQKLPDIGRRIERIEKEIQHLIRTKPYIYRFDLENREKRKQKKAALQEEIREYEEYSRQLSDILAEFEGKVMRA